MATLTLDASQWPQPWPPVLFEVGGGSEEKIYRGPLDDHAPVSKLDLPPGFYRVAIYCGNRVQRLHINIKEAEEQFSLVLPDPRREVSTTGRAVPLKEGWADSSDQASLTASVQRMGMKLPVCSSRNFIQTAPDLEGHAVLELDVKKTLTCWMRMWSYTRRPDVAGENAESFTPSRWLGTLVGESDTGKVFRIRRQPASATLLEYAIAGYASRFTLLPPADVTLRTSKPAADSDSQRDQLSTLVPNIEIDVPNSLGDTLLNLLTRGDMLRAASLGETFVKDHWQSDRLDLVSALAGGYYLSRVQNTSSLLMWSTRVLQRFGPYPDSVILHAWALLHSGESVDLAKKEFQNALHLGLPYFTEGLQLLVDGLRLFRSEFTEKVFRLDTYTDAAVWTQPCTTYSGDSPDRPGRGPIKSKTPDGDNQNVVFW